MYRILSEAGRPTTFSIHQLQLQGVDIPTMQSVPLATTPKPLSSKIPFGLVRVPVHFNVH